MKTALLIIDIQNDYFVGGTMTLTGSDSAGMNAGKILEYFRTAGLPMVHIQHIATKPTAMFFLPDTSGAEIYKSVTPLVQEKVVIKHYPNSFRDTGLHEYLQSTGITDLVICGMMTHMCVDATTRAAKDAGYTCTVIGDACATKDLELNDQKVKAKDVQVSFLAALDYYYSTVMTTEQYLNLHQAEY